jgi:hypothetical protein
MKRSQFWDANLELEPLIGQPGWSIYTGSDGDDPWFLGFFIRKSDAEALLRLRDPEDGVTPLYCDPVIVPSLLTEHGVVTANDYQIKTHEQLRERLATVGVARG